MNIFWSKWGCKQFKPCSDVLNISFPSAPSSSDHTYMCARASSVPLFWLRGVPAEWPNDSVVIPPSFKIWWNQTAHHYSVVMETSSSKVLLAQSPKHQTDRHKGRLCNKVQLCNLFLKTGLQSVPPAWKKLYSFSDKKFQKKSAHFFFHSLTASVTELIWKYCFLNHWAAVYRSSLLTFRPLTPLRDQTAEKSSSVL